MKPGFFLFFLFSFFVACASQPRWVWYSPLHGEEKLAVDVEECRADAAQEVVGPRFGMEYLEEKERLYRDCMALRGWSIVPVSDVDVPWEKDGQRYPVGF